MDAIKIEPSDLMMYLVDRKFMQDMESGRSFSERLLAEDVGRARAIFAKFDNPILESICYLKYDLGIDDPDELTKMVTQALKSSGNKGFDDAYSDDKLTTILQSLDVEHKVINFADEKIRNRVYEQLAEELNTDARLFAHFLLPYNKVKNIFLDKCYNVKDCVFETFKVWDRITESKLRTWRSIRQILIILNKPGYIKSIEKKFGGETIGQPSNYRGKIQQHSQNLKDFYKEKLKDCIQSKPFKGKSGRENVKTDRKHMYVQLMMGEWLDAHECDIEHFLKSMYQQRNTIEMHQLIDKEDKFVILRGIAGVGKTSFVDSLLLNWANGDIYQEFDFVVKLSCRELNVLSNINSIEDLLNCQYPGELGTVLLNCSDKRKLVIIDGLDEFRYLKDVIKTSQGNPTDHSVASVVYNLINPNSYLLSNKTVVLCGRPKASEEIYGCFRTSVTCKLVEITGFSKETVSVFIEQHFSEDKKQGELMKQKLKEQEYLQSMVRIPIYAYILCNVFQSGALIEELNTTTKLNIACCLCFLRDHMRQNQGQNVSFIEMCADETIIPTIVELSKFAYISLVEQRIVFNADAFRSSKYLSDIEASGIFEKHEGGENGDIYQFKHLVLQEFLSAIHILAEGLWVHRLIEKPHLSNSLVIFVGLVGLLQEACGAPEYLKLFAATISGKNRDTSIKDVEQLIQSSTDKTEYDSPTLSTTLTYVYEYHCRLSETLEEYFLRRSEHFWIRSHIEVEQLLYFLKNVKIKTLDHIEIIMPYCQMSLNEIEEIVQYLANTKTVALCKLPQELFQHLSEEIIKVNKEKPIVPSVLHDAKTLLQDLTLEGCNDEAVIALLKSIPFLKSLDLQYNNNLTAICFKELSKCLCDAFDGNKNSLKRLDLRGCILNDDSIIELSKSMPCLESLVLSRNQRITPNGFHEISKYVCAAFDDNNNCLKHLYLHGCNLDDDCIIALSKSIPCLESIILTHNPDLTSKAYNEISKCLRDANNKNCLKRLNICGCNIDRKSYETLHHICMDLKCNLEIDDDFAVLVLN